MTESYRKEVTEVSDGRRGRHGRVFFDPERHNLENTLKKEEKEQ
jgi:hypothetical protein